MTQWTCRAKTGRRGFLRLAATGIAGMVLGVSLSASGGESPGDPRSETTPDRRAARAAGGRILLAYFSRPGEN